MLVNPVEYDRRSNAVSCVRGAVLRTYPHHLTTDLPVLPVPELAESLERYRKSSAAVLNAEAEADMNQAIADFAIGPAPALQQTLEQYAETMAESGSNWMAEQWLEQYLRVRQPLLLTSNVTFQLNLVTASTGVERVVECPTYRRHPHFAGKTPTHRSTTLEANESRWTVGQTLTVDSYSGVGKTNGCVPAPVPRTGPLGYCTGPHVGSSIYGSEGKLWTPTSCENQSVRAISNPAC